jgi:hypothetical protein
MGSDSNNNNEWFDPTSDIDVHVRNEGAIFLFTPITPRAKQWIAANVQSEAQWFGQALVVEHRYALGLAVGMRDAGLVLS